MKRPGKGAKSEELEKYARKLGWELLRTTGKHPIFAKNGKQVQIPYHGCQPVSLGVYASIVKTLEAR